MFGTFFSFLCVKMVLWKFCRKVKEMEYTIREIADMLGVEKDTLKVLSRQHKLKRAEFGHHKTYKVNGVQQHGYVYFDYAVPIFQEIIKGIEQYSENQEASRKRY